MPRVFLGLGSNEDRERHLCAGLDALKREFGQLWLSPVYDSESVGFVGRPFLNMVVAIDTALPVGELSQFLKALEDEYGRSRCIKKYSPRTLDIDILLYDDLVGLIDGVELPRSEITENAFVLRPLADLAPTAMHPRLQVSFASLWTEYKRPQKLWPIELVWEGKVVKGDKVSEDAPH